MHITKRIHWLDILKGIAVILVIMGHALDDTWLRTWIYSFHLGIFYFAAGYTFDISKYKSLLEFVRKRSKGILLPYIKYSFYTILFISGWTLLKGEASLMDIVSQAWNSIVGTVIMLRGSNYQSYCWFLPALFIAECVFFVIEYYLQNKYFLKAIICACCYSVGTIYQVLCGVSLPMYLDIVPITILFIWIGHDLKNKTFCNKNICLMFLSLLFSIILSIWEYRNSIRIDIYEHSVINPAVLLIGYLFGIMAMLGISMIIEENSVFEYIGKNSLYFYALHRPVIFYPVRFLLSSITILSFPKYSILKAFLLASITVLLLFIGRKLLDFFENRIKRRVSNKS